MGLLEDISGTSEALLKLWANALNYVQGISIAVQLIIIIAVFILVKLLIQPRLQLLKNPEPRCQLIKFGDSSVDLELRIWILDPVNGRANVVSEVLLQVWDRFHQHGIKIVFPQRDLHINTVLGNHNIADIVDQLQSPSPISK